MVGQKMSLRTLDNSGVQSRKAGAEEEKKQQGQVVRSATALHKFNGHKTCLAPCQRACLPKQKQVGNKMAQRVRALLFDTSSPS
jgi:hypothetical protein